MANKHKTRKAVPYTVARSGNGNHQILQKFQGYYLSDIACDFCPFKKPGGGGKKQLEKNEGRKCGLDLCLFEAERQEAVKSNRIQRPRQLVPAVW